MWPKCENVISVVRCITISFVLTSGVSAQNASPISLKEQLAAQYKLVKMGSDSSGTTAMKTSSY